MSTMKSAKPGSVKFRIVMAIVVAIPFAIVMSGIMSLIGIKMAGLPTAIWGPAFLRVWPVFTVLADPNQGVLPVLNTGASAE